MATLKSLLGEALTPELEAKLPEETKKILDHEIYDYDGSNKGLKPMPQYRVDEILETEKNKNTDLTNQVKTLEDANAAFDKDLKALKKVAGDKEAAEQKIEEIENKRKEDAENWEREKETLAKNYAAKEKSLMLRQNLLDAKVEDTEAREILALRIEKQLGDKMEFDEKGVLKNKDEVLKPYKENPVTKTFFGETKKKGPEHREKEIEDEKENPFSKKYLNLTEQIRIKKEDPEKAAKLEAAARN
jgi:hypothetical protein